LARTITLHNNFFPEKKISPTHASGEEAPLPPLPCKHNKKDYCWMVYA